MHSHGDESASLADVKRCKDKRKGRIGSTITATIVGGKTRKKKLLRFLLLRLNVIYYSHAAAIAAAAEVMMMMDRAGCWLDTARRRQRGSG